MMVDCHWDKVFCFYICQGFKCFYCWNTIRSLPIIIKIFNEFQLVVVQYHKNTFFWKKKSLILLKSSSIIKIDIY